MNAELYNSVKGAAKQIGRDAGQGQGQRHNRVDDGCGDAVEWVEEERIQHARDNGQQNLKQGIIVCKLGLKE